MLRLAAQDRTSGMKKQKQPHRKSGRATGKSGPSGAVRSTAHGEGGDAAIRDPATVKSTAGKTSAAAERFLAGVRTPAFRIAFGVFLAGVLSVAGSLAIPHEFAFFELGYLFTLSIYDLVLAMLGLSVAIGMAERRREVLSIAGAFLGVIAPVLLFFDPIFSAILQSPLGHELFLIAPIAVMLSGVVLWLPAFIRRFAAPVAAAVVGLSLSLFIGLDDFGIGIKEFAFTAVLAALWILVVPGMMLRPFRGAWLTIPARIIGSWLMVIAVIVTVSLYVPLSPDAPPLPELLDGPELAPLDPAVEDGLLEAPESFDSPAEGSTIPGPEVGDNPLLGGGRNRQP
ncbi:hypothetical protein QWE_20668 [Agrobacterium albertimagni AOL15]|uniref:Transmembrane protein n=2 Tax=Agrobacterium albertimagni TaxID=147266 RepID=K2Q1N7_9HYPH|nr:hypothetical protein QWE_20668 [Agrobacterium albertimagni AOL15]